jgi:hypothetical protein
VVVDLEGSAYEVTPEDFSRCPVLGRPGYELLRQFVSNELGHKEETDHQPKHIEYMRAHELLDYCEVSEKGHYKWYPNGLLIQRLILDYAAQLAREAGALALRYFHRELDYTAESKGEQQDWVSVADRSVEAHCRAQLADAFPGDAMYGEETGGVNKTKKKSITQTNKSYKNSCKES